MSKRFGPYPPRVILWGGTGQAKVVRPILEGRGARVVAVFDDTPDLPAPFPDVPLYCGWPEFELWIRKEDPSSLGFCVTIGNPHGRVRLRLHDRLTGMGLTPVTAVHPTAWIADNATIGAGSQILAGAIIAAEARLGRECIVNTNGSVDHEAILADGVEVGAGAIICGLVTLDVNVWVATGATVLPRLSVGADAIIGAGALVSRDVPAAATLVGVPARRVPRE